jgi:hypothetical protein
MTARRVFVKPLRKSFFYILNAGRWPTPSVTGIPLARKLSGDKLPSAVIGATVEDDPLPDMLV